jgi:hypothetical protein
MLCAITMKYLCLPILRLIVLTTPLIQLAACSSTNVINLEGSDSTRFKDFQTSFRVSSEDETQRIKLRISETKGEFTQDIAEGKIVEFEDFNLVGPDQVQSKADLTMWSISYGRIDQVLREKFFMSAFAGISRTNFEIDMESASGLSTGVRNRSFEAYVDLSIYREVLPYLTAGLAAAFSRNLTLSGITEWEAFFGFIPYKHIHIIGGYRWFKYDYFTEDFDSGIIVELNGPFIKLDIPF